MRSLPCIHVLKHSINMKVLGHISVILVVDAAETDVLSNQVKHTITIGWISIRRNSIFCYSLI